MQFLVTGDQVGSTILRVFVALAILCASATPASSQGTQSFKVIVNVRGPFDSTLRRADAEACFLKKTTKLKDVAVVPFDQPLDSSSRRGFSTAVMLREPRAVHSYWQQKLFTGQGLPPKEVKNDAAAIAAVAATPGGIGYVAADAAIADSVRVLSIVE